MVASKMAIVAFVITAEDTMWNAQMEYLVPQLLILHMVLRFKQVTLINHRALMLLMRPIFGHLRHQHRPLHQHKQQVGHQV